jgi:hypothetical protein
MSKYDERRKELRKKVMAFTPVYDLKKGVLLGFLQNLTLQGALVIGEKTMEVNTQTILGLDLPGDLPDVATNRLTISARVARCIEDEEAVNAYQLGFEFIDIQPEQIQVIEALLERYHFRHKIE